MIDGPGRRWPLHPKQVFHSGNDVMFRQYLTRIQLHHRMEARKINRVYAWKQRVLEMVAIIVSETVEEWGDTGIGGMNYVVLRVDGMHHV